MRSRRAIRDVVRARSSIFRSSHASSSVRCRFAAGVDVSWTSDVVREILLRWTVPLSEGVGEGADPAARADGGGTHRSGSRRLMQLLQGKRRSHFCFRRTVRMQ